jgi:hypothetical protein
MTAANVFEAAFGKIYGKPCWSVEQGHGSFLTFEFGKPHLDVHEPIVASKTVSSRVRKGLERRLIHARGQWHLWIYCCAWEVLSNGRRVGHSESTDIKIQRAADFLNGQKLVRFSNFPRKYQCLFEFDLGGRLKTRPYDKESVQWRLFEPSKRVLSLRADGLYRHIHSDTPGKEDDWKPLKVDGS